MSKVAVHQAESGKAAVHNCFLDKVEAEMEAVRRRAYELFEARGCETGREIEDWLQAEQDLFFVPQAELEETAKGFTIRIAAPGFTSGEFEVIALPREVLVEAKHTKRTGSPDSDQAGGLIETKCLYRRFELGAPVEVNKVRATLEKGELKIEAPRQALQPVSVRAAAA